MKKELKKILSNVNIIGVPITRPTQELVIMRGIPGSGKSTKAKSLVKEGVIHSTDDVIESFGDYSEHFRKMDEAKDWSAHGKMHSINLSNSIKSMKSGVSPVIVDNTNVRMGEARKYVMEALAMGFDDKNIRFEEVGTGGATAEELCARNAHGVPLDVIESMIKTLEASGPLSVKRIVETAGETKKKILYSAIVLDDKSRSKLLTALGHKIPKDWSIIAHHMTVAFAKGFPEDLSNFVDANVDLKATAIGISDMAIAVRVEGFPSSNEIPHITLAVNTVAGGKPVMSNAITNWTKLENYINLSGIGREITA